MFVKNPYTCTLIIRNYVTRKSFNSEIGVATESRKKYRISSIKTVNQEGKGRLQRRQQQVFTSTADNEIATCLQSLREARFKVKNKNFSTKLAILGYTCIEIIWETSQHQLVFGIHFQTLCEKVVDICNEPV